MAIIKRPPKQATSNVDLTNPEVRSYNTVEAIYARAEKLGIKTFPFDVITYLKIHGVKVAYEEMEDLSGCVELKEQNAIVTINKYQNKTRQRFTAAHELAHIILHFPDIERGVFKEGENILFRDNETINNTERQANQLAAEILMPKNIFDSLLKDGVRNIERLAEKFNVSPAAVRYRAYKLGYIQGY